MDFTVELEDDAELGASGPLLRFGGPTFSFLCGSTGLSALVLEAVTLELAGLSEEEDVRMEQLRDAKAGSSSSPSRLLGPVPERTAPVMTKCRVIKASARVLRSGITKTRLELVSDAGSPVLCVANQAELGIDVLQRAKGAYLSFIGVIGRARRGTVELEHERHQRGSG